MGRRRIARRRVGRRDRLRLARRRPAEGGIVENRKIFGDRAARRRIEILDLGHSPPAMRVGHDHARVDRERLAADQPFLHAARHHRLKQLAQKVALAKTPMAILREGRMVGNLAVEPQPAEIE